MQPYSKEFRRDVLAACDAGDGTREVTLKFDVSESWVRRIKQQRRETGQVAPQTTRNRRRETDDAKPATELAGVGRVAQGGGGVHTGCVFA